MLLTPFLMFVRFHDYGLLRPEIILIVFLLVVLGLILGGLIALRPLVLRPLLFAFLTLLFIDLHFTLASRETLEFFSKLGGERMALVFQIGAVATGLFAAFMATWLLRRHLGVIFLSTFGVMLATTLLLPVETMFRGKMAPAGNASPGNASPGNGRGLLLHLILDEHIGIEGVPTDIPGGVELKTEMKRFYEDFGFKLYGRAFTEYSETADSLTSLLNGGKPVTAGASPEAPGNASGAPANIWFDTLFKEGYRIRVYQSDFLDFCDHPGVAYCYVYSANSINSLIDTDLAVTDKARLIIGSFFSGALTYRFVSVFKQVMARFLSSSSNQQLGEPYINAIPSLKLFDRIKENLKEESRGTAIFAHFLLPHHSYVFDSECRLQTNISNWTNRLRTLFNNSSDSRIRRYRMYFKQVRCTYKKLSELFNSMRQAGTFDDATIIVHGDHGSRIALNEPRLNDDRRSSDTEIIDFFSALFAVKTPGAERGYDRRMLSIQELFAETMLKYPPVEGNRGIFIESGSSYLRRPMAVLPGAPER